MARNVFLLFLQGSRPSSNKAAHVMAKMFSHQACGHCWCQQLLSHLEKTQPRTFWYFSFSFTQPFPPVTHSYIYIYFLNSFRVTCLNALGGKIMRKYKFSMDVSLAICQYICSVFFLKKALKCTNSFPFVQTTLQHILRG